MMRGVFAADQSCRPADHRDEMLIVRHTPPSHHARPLRAPHHLERPITPGRGLSQPATGTPSPTRRALLATPLLVAAAHHARADPAPLPTVFVAGATGQTGSRVVAELRRRGYPVIAGVRSPAKAASLGFDRDPGIRIVRADVTEGVEALANAIGNAQAVVCALGYNGGSDPQGFAQVDSQVGTLKLNKQRGA